MTVTYDSYLAQRAATEQERARRATCPEAMRAHAELASRYLARARDPDDPG